MKARKVLRAGLPPTSDQSATKHYDRLAADSIYRLVRAMESLGLAWSIRDIAVSLSAFSLAYPQLRKMLHHLGARQAMVELGHLASSYRNPKGVLDTAKISENLRGIASELHSISGSEIGRVFCTQYTDLVLTDAILRGKIIYFMLPRLEEAESAARMVKVFREDLEVSIGEITSARQYHLEDPHLVIIDEGSSTFGPTWANLFELARKGRFSLIFGAQSTGGLTDLSLGLSEAFYERVMANVNVKVMMRIGDNRTAQDMADWIGKVTTTRKSVGAGVTMGKSSSALRGALDVQAKITGGESETINVTEDEEDLVSSEELKHEMSAEKGLAWFDLGDGKIVKGRSFWFNAEIPDNWEGREYIPQLEKYENDEIGLADWVDEQILYREREEAFSEKKPKTTATPKSTSTPKETGSEGEKKQEQQNPEASGSFKLGLLPPGSARRRGTISTFNRK
ncbi:MAG: TraM recognition domain-containing protein [SAR324 cluster bacterium]|uniref:TraM recognition domain-containing protein n=1 Tax=SAR324 cluster bacterium TaxID=2024889 RepID=A0A7X9FR72_9DELT|nr:TraM recognition domain-containing protein [SAR324 cluster bacterium]